MFCNPKQTDIFFFYSLRKHSKTILTYEVQAYSVLLYSKIIFRESY